MDEEQLSETKLAIWVCVNERYTLPRHPLFVRYKQFSYKLAIPTSK